MGNNIKEALHLKNYLRNRVKANKSENPKFSSVACLLDLIIFFLKNLTFPFFFIQRFLF
jgi:hypothetical protein